MRHVKNVNLPESAEHIVLGEAYAELEESLRDLNLAPIFIPNNPNIDPRLSGHCDLSVLYAGDKKLFLAEYLKDNSVSVQFTCLGFNVEYPSISFGKSYPNDCGLNICFLGDTVIYNKQTACKEVVNGLDAKRQILCNQGYSKCLVCPVDDNSIITSDKGIAKSAKSHGLNVLEIAQGHIDLPGFQYGFIGGSAFKKSKDKLVFTGTLDQHPDKSRILDFINKRGVEAVYLTDRNIFDVGSILPLTEKVR